MTRFQLDQCTSSRRVVDACRAEGHGDALPLPRSLHDTPDADLVPAVLAGGAVFVTTDRLLPRQCAGLIPDSSRNGFTCCRPDGGRMRFLVNENIPRTVIDGRPGFGRSWGRASTRRS